MLLGQETSEGGSFVVTPDPVLVASTLIMLAAIVAGVIVLVRRRRVRVAGVAGPASVRWIRLTRRVVELAMALVGLGLVAAVVVLLVAPEGVSSEAGPIAISGGQVQITVEPSFASASFGADEGDTVVAARQRAYEEMFGSGAKPLSDGAVDAEVLVDDAPLGLWLVAMSTLALTYVLVAGFLLALRSVLVRAEAGQPFSKCSVSSLRWMALILGPGVLLMVLGRYVAGTMAVEAGGGSASIAWHFPWFWLLASLVLLALSEVWRYGAALQDDVEATV